MNERLKKAIRLGQVALLAGMVAAISGCGGENSTTTESSAPPTMPGQGAPSGPGGSVPGPGMNAPGGSK